MSDKIKNATQEHPIHTKPIKIKCVSPEVLPKYETCSYDSIDPTFKSSQNENLNQLSKEKICSVHFFSRRRNKPNF